MMGSSSTTQDGKRRFRAARVACRPPAGISVGVAAAITSAAIWGSALTMTRLGVSGPAAFGPGDIAMMRFFLPAIVLLPVLWCAWPRLVQMSPFMLISLISGGGVPFVLVAGMGLRSAAAAEAGALLPGTIPLCVVALSTVLGEPIGRQRLLGLGFIVVAVTMIAGPAILTGNQEAWSGYILLLVAATLAGAYAIALRRTGLRPLEAAALVSFGSVVTFGPIYLLTMEPRLLVVPVFDLALQVAYQGLVPGLVAPIAFAIAVSRLGASGAAAFGGLSPAAAALFGGVLLAETPNETTLLGIAIAGVGAVLVSELVHWHGLAPAARDRISAQMPTR